MGELSPAILAGLAMVMRVDLARFSDLVTTAALFRPPGPTEDELKPLSAEDLNLRLHIDHPEAHCRAQGATSRLPAPSARTIWGGLRLAPVRRAALAAAILRPRHFSLIVLGSSRGTCARRTMADRKQLAIFKRGPEAWNAWRDSHPRTGPRLDRADLAHSALHAVNLTSAHLADANIAGAYLSRSQLARDWSGCCAI